MYNLLEEIKKKVKKITKGKINKIVSDVRFTHGSNLTYLMIKFPKT
ncbi:MAG: hypothetical protein AABY22_06910 [Nanoarchaeota archaeon]